MLRSKFLVYGKTLLYLWEKHSQRNTSLSASLWPSQRRTNLLRLWKRFQILKIFWEPACFSPRCSSATLHSFRMPAAAVCLISYSANQQKYPLWLTCWCLSSSNWKGFMAIITHSARSPSSPSRLHCQTKEVFCTSCWWSTEKLLPRPGILLTLQTAF